MTLLALLFLAQVALPAPPTNVRVAQSPPPMPYPEPPPPPPLNVNVTFSMPVAKVPVSITKANLGLAESQPIPVGVECQGHVQQGSVRFFVDKTAPSATIGTLAPWSPDVRNRTRNVYATTITLWGESEVAGFKAVSAVATTSTIQWNCAVYP